MGVEHFKTFACDARDQRWKGETDGDWKEESDEWKEREGEESQEEGEEVEEREKEEEEDEEEEGLEEKQEERFGQKATASKLDGRTFECSNIVPFSHSYLWHGRGMMGTGARQRAPPWLQRRQWAKDCHWQNEK